MQFQLESKLATTGTGGDLIGASEALDGLAWFGRDSGATRKRIAKAWLERGEPDRAIVSLQQSLALEPDVTAFSELAYLEQQRGDLQASLAALEAGLVLDPDRLGLLHRAGETALAMGLTGKAESLLMRAVAVDPTHAPSQDALERARRVRARNDPLASRGADSP